LAAAPAGALREEALLGAMESAAAGGDGASAAALARRYLEAFPGGLGAATASVAGATVSSKAAGPRADARGSVPLVARGPDPLARSSAAAAARARWLAMALVAALACRRDVELVVRPRPTSGCTANDGPCAAGADCCSGRCADGRCAA